MTTQTISRSVTGTAAKASQELQQIFRDAPEVARQGLKNLLPELSQDSGADAPHAESAGRVGVRLGSVSELTLMAPFATGGAKRLRAMLQFLNGNFSNARKVGTLHNMRFVFLDNDKTLLFATAYDGQWDPYIEDFAIKIPDEMDVIFSACEGWPGIRNVQKTKDWIFAHQIPAEGWYVADPDLTVAEAGRLKRIGKATEEFLDKIG